MDWVGKLPVMLNIHVWCFIREHGEEMKYIIYDYSSTSRETEVNIYIDKYISQTLPKL